MGPPTSFTFLSEGTLSNLKTKDSLLLQIIFEPVTMNNSVMIWEEFATLSDTFICTLRVFHSHLEMFEIGANFTFSSHRMTVEVELS